MNLKNLLDLYMRVNSVSRQELAESIGIPKAAVRRLCEGKPVSSEIFLVVLAWLFAAPDGE